MLLVLTGNLIASDVSKINISAGSYTKSPTKESLEWTKYTHAEWSSLTDLGLSIAGLSSQQEVVQAEMLRVYNYPSCGNCT